MHSGEGYKVDVFDVRFIISCLIFGNLGRTRIFFKFRDFFENKTMGSEENIYNVFKIS